MLGNIAPSLPVFLFFLDPTVASPTSLPIHTVVMASNGVFALRTATMAPSVLFFAEGRRGYFLSPPNMAEWENIG